jgi:hypothetical protein
MASTIPSGGVHTTGVPPPVPVELDEEDDDDALDDVPLSLPPVLEDVSPVVVLVVEPPAPVGAVSPPPQP